ncbi:MAG: sigma-54 dependent transcriptional regulator [Candidatus Sulfotelmatobacter sp.]|jgi:DNA-binding NtrC family response regulator
MSATTTFPAIATATTATPTTATAMFATGAGGALIASPSSALREQVLHSMNGRWRPVQHALGGADALAKLEAGDWQILFLDRRLPDLDSDELIALVQRRFPGIQVVLLDSDVPFPAGDAGEMRQTNSETTNSETTNSETTEAEMPEAEEVSRGYAPLPGMIGRSEAMQRVYRMAGLVAPRSTSVLIVGPTGSGKELVARALHELSPRAARPFVAVNCAAIPEALLESELFGHARGAFTGAVQAQVGRIPAAHGGTLFLDEVSELPLGMQAKLLRFLEQKEVQRLGTAELTRVDVRVIAASNVDLAGRAGRGEFREDLFYRLSAFPLELPPLTERRSDIIPLAEHFLACMAAAMSAACPRLSPEAVRVLEAHPWKGNVRELQHVMERASILVENGSTVLSEHLYFPFQHALAPNAARSLSCAGRAS